MSSEKEVIGGRIWNKLDSKSRLKLLTHAHRAWSDELRAFEAKLNWNSLLPSSQQDLLRVDWSLVLGKKYWGILERVH